MSHSPDWSILERDIASEEDVAAAFAALAWVKSKRKAAEARCEQQVARARQLLADSCRVEVGDTTFSFADAERALDSSLVRYADAHRDRLFATRRTASFDLGDIRIRKRSSSVTFAPGETAKTVIPRVEDPRFLRVKHELDLVTIKSHVEKQLLTIEQLAEYGLIYDAGSDEISVHLGE